jgi:hypothetical protein
VRGEELRLLRGNEFEVFLIGDCAPLKPPGPALKPSFQAHYFEA